MSVGEVKKRDVIDRTWRLRDLRRKEAELCEAILAVQHSVRMLETRRQVLRRYLKRHGNKLERGHEPATYHAAGLTQCAKLIETEGETVWQ